MPGRALAVTNGDDLAKAVVCLGQELLFLGVVEDLLRGGRQRRNVACFRVERHDVEVVAPGHTLMIPDADTERAGFPAPPVEL